MTSVGFIGTGLMGTPMARRLIRAGHSLSVWNRTASKADPLVQEGAHRARTPADAASSADVVITMVADPDALEHVVAGTEGIFSSIAPGSILIDMSTVGPDVITSLADRLPRGVGFLDAPILGSVPQATDGTLDIFAGGDRSTFDACRTVLDVLGSPRYVGRSGSGAAIKLVVNSALLSLMCTLGEALALGDSFGLEESTILDVLESSPIGPTTTKKRHNIESGTYTPRFRLVNGVKDARLVLDAAARHGVHLRHAEATRSWYADALGAGRGEDDYAAVIAEIRTSARDRDG